MNATRKKIHRYVGFGMMGLGALVFLVTMLILSYWKLWLGYEVQDIWETRVAFLSIWSFITVFAGALIQVPGTAG